MGNFLPSTSGRPPLRRPSFAVAAMEAIQAHLVKNGIIHRKQVSTIESLPNELLFEILLLLPPDFLYEKARFVCRKWYEIVNSDDFITWQTRRSTSGLLLSTYTHYNRPIYVTSVQGRIQSHALSYECRTGQLGSCNGLVAEFGLDNGGGVTSVHVTNPATKQSPFLLPPLPPLGDGESYGACHIAYSPASKEYKLVIIYFGYAHCAGMLILTAGVDKSWRDVPIWLLPDDLALPFDEHVLSTEGFLHWPGVEGLLTLNVETETFTYGEMPKICQYPFDRLQSSGKYLSASCRTDELVWEIWEMKPEESDDRWRNLHPLKIDLRPLKRTIQRYAPGHEELHRLVPIGWVKYLEVLAFHFWDEGRTCIFYNLDTHEIDTIDLPEPNNRYKAFLHKTNLVWLS